MLISGPAPLLLNRQVWDVQNLVVHCQPTPRPPPEEQQHADGQHTAHDMSHISMSSIYAEGRAWQAMCH